MEDNKGILLTLIIIVLVIGGAVLIGTNRNSNNLNNPDLSNLAPSVATDDTNADVMDTPEGNVVEVAMQTPEGNVVEVAMQTPELSTFLTAVESADLGPTLAGSGPYTIFAPSNEAFSAIPEEQLTELLADKEALATLLTQHVVDDLLYSGDVAGSSALTSLNGTSLAVETDITGAIMIESAVISDMDIEANNGVIHIIDKVILAE